MENNIDKNFNHSQDDSSKPVTTRNNQEKEGKECLQFYKKE